MNTFSEIFRPRLPEYPMSMAVDFNICENRFVILAFAGNNFFRGIVTTASLPFRKNAATLAIQLHSYQ